MIVADTSGLLALFNDQEPRHLEVVEALSTERDPLVVSPFVVAELDYLVGTRIGIRAESAMLRELAGPGYQLASVDDDVLTAATMIVEKYSDQQIGVADATNVVLARRYRTNRLLTLDRRHFGVMRTATGRPFVLVP